MQLLDGRRSATELLATDDLRLSWLRELSERLTALDAAVAEEDAAAAAAVRHALRQTAALRA